MAETTKVTAPTLEDRVKAACAALNIATIYEPVLTEACRIFGIDPDPELRPRQLLAVRGYGNADAFEPLSIVIVTAGGLKIRWPLDADSEHRLRYEVFRAFRKVRVPGSREEKLEELALPRDLTLPRPAVTGIPPARTGV